MAKVGGPRHGSMQFWPRKRASSEVARLRSRHTAKDSPVDGFYGYKVGMTHVSLKDTGSNSLTKNQVVVKPATIIECPPLKIAGVRLYLKDEYGLHATGDYFSNSIDSSLSKHFSIPKGKDFPKDECDDIRLLAYTVPGATSLGKKKPAFFEIALSGSIEDKKAFAQEKYGKEITVSDVFKQHELVDIHGVTTGRGYQGSVKRFGIQIRAKKSEKVTRGPGSLGPWKAQQHIMYRIAHAGQTGYHQRTEYNKPVIYIGDDVDKVNPNGGFVRYGNVSSTYIIVLGSILGPRKRMVRLSHPQRPNAKKKTNALELQSISTISRQR